MGKKTKAMPGHRTPKKVVLLPHVFLLCCVVCGARDAMGQHVPEIVLDGLDNPCGVAVQPDTGDVFLSDSGAGRVVRLANGKAEDVITGFPRKVYGDGPSYEIGPLGLAFLGRDMLAVGGGGQGQGVDVIRVYKIPSQGAAAISYDNVIRSLGPLAAGDSVPGEGVFFALAATGKAIFTTAQGDNAKGWVVRSDRSGGVLGELRRFIATKEAVGVDAPVGLAVSDQGHLVIGQVGELAVPKDSLLCFYGADSGKLLLALETELHDIIALDYGPRGHLYALDFAWLDASQGGLFRLDAGLDRMGQQSVNAVKIASLDKPTSLAFGGDGALYVTVIGTSRQADDKQGKLLKFAPGL